MPPLTEATAATAVLAANPIFQEWPAETAVPAEMAAWQPSGKQAKAETAAWLESVSAASAQAPEEPAALVASVDRPHRELVELVVLAVPQLVLQVRVRAFHQLGLAESAGHRALEPAVPEEQVAAPLQQQTAPIPTLAPKPLVALVEWAEPLPSADAAALGVAPSPMATRLQPQQVAMAELAEA